MFFAVWPILNLATLDCVSNETHVFQTVGRMFCFFFFWDSLDCIGSLVAMLIYYIYTCSIYIRDCIKTSTTVWHALVKNYILVRLDCMWTFTFIDEIVWNVLKTNTSLDCISDIELCISYQCIRNYLKYLLLDTVSIALYLSTILSTTVSIALERYEVSIALGK